MSQFSTVNPSNDLLIHTYTYDEFSVAQKKMEMAHANFSLWKSKTLAERGSVLKAVAVELRAHKDQLASLVHGEMGKKVDDAKAEIEKCARTCEFYADSAEAMLKEEVLLKSPYRDASIGFSPQGVILSIMPWNFPVWQVLRFAAPVLMVGNTILLKHSEITCGTGLLIAEIFRKAFKEYEILIPILSNHDDVAKLMESPLIRGVTFTGSSRGGREVAATAGRSLKKTVLELGGSDAYVILSDANLHQAAASCAAGRLQNAGQSCVAAKRFIVHDQVYEEFVELLKQNLSSAMLAPLAAKKFQAQLHEQVKKLIELGGQLSLGGNISSTVGAFYPASVIEFKENVEDPKIHSEELFGPVALVFKVDSEEQAFRLANLSPYGLGGAIFTADIERAKVLAREKMDTGFVAINDIVKSDPTTPFGGVKDSGYGRELSRYGLLEFANIKTVGVGK